MKAPCREPVSFGTDEDDPARLVVLEVDWNYTSICRCCRKILVGSVVRVGKKSQFGVKTEFRRKTAKILK
jgi:hypothetical protein